MCFTEEIVLKSEMEWVRALQKGHELKTMARQYLRRYGLTSEAEATQPFAKMEPGKVICLILNWLTLHFYRQGNLELRINAEEEKMVYKAKIYLQRGNIRIRKVKKAPQLIGKMLHQWDDQVNYDTLTVGTLVKSVQTADIINERQEVKVLLQDVLEL